MNCVQLGIRYNVLVDRKPELAPRCPSTDRPLAGWLGQWAFLASQTEGGERLDIVHVGGDAMVEQQLLSKIPVGHSLDNGGGCWAVRRMGQAARWYPTPLEALLVFHEEAP